MGVENWKAWIGYFCFALLILDVCWRFFFFLKEKDSI